MTIEASSPQDTKTGWKPIDACPECGGVELHPVFDSELMNFLCPLCMSCWHVELGFVHKVNSETCPGCQYQLTCREHQRSHPVALVQGRPTIRSGYTDEWSLSRDGTAAGR